MIRDLARRGFPSHDDGEPELCFYKASVLQKRQRGSHKQFRHPDGRSTTAPVHRGRDISPILLRQIAKEVGITVEEVVARD